MQEKNILVFEKPDLYFFSHLKGKVFAPFSVSNRSFSYLIYKGLSILNLPGREKYWGEWKEHLQQAEKVILFDYGYQKGMETYIRKVNPKCRVYLYCWNMIDRTHNNYRLFTDPDAIYSTDWNDCRTYGLRYQHIFYPKELYQPYQPGKERKLFFMGQDKGRGEELLRWKKVLEKAGISCDIRVLFSGLPENEKEKFSEVRCEEPLAYNSYLQEMEKAGILLDLTQKGQTALTMRVMEALFYSKKLITTNPSVRDCEFFHEDNILVADGKPEGMEEKIRIFLEKPYHEIEEEVRNLYSYEHWIASFE